MGWLPSTLLVIALAPPQVQPPIYRAGVYLVPYRIVTTPPVELKLEDVLFVVDGQDMLPTDLLSDPRIAGAFTAYYAPARGLRDGRPHDLLVKVRTKNTWRTIGSEPHRVTFDPIQTDGSAPPPVFRGDAYAVPVRIALLERKNRKDVFLTGLTRDDFLLVLDNRDFPAIAAGESPDKPGHYTIYFQPPERYRDGKVHDIKLKILVDGKWKRLPPKWPTLIPKPPK